MLFFREEDSRKDRLSPGERVNKHKGYNRWGWVEHWRSQLQWANKDY